MKILVSIKRIPDPEQKLKLQDKRLDVSSTTWQMNQFDEYAIEAALRLTENVADPLVRLGEVVVVSVGSIEVQQQLRTALAMGADRAILVNPKEELLDGFMISRCLQEVVKRENPDIVIMGKLASDDEGGEVGQRLAALLGWPQACFASDLTLEKGSSLLVGREVDAGVEYKRVTLPAVITVDLRIITPHAVKNGVTSPEYAYQEGARYASLKGIMAAKKKPLDELTLEALGIQASPLLIYEQVELPTPRKAGVRVASASELVEKLRQDAKVI